MGGSGSGKSTLLNILNGNYPPSNGEIKINGINLYKDPKSLEGVIGFVPQDDLLIEKNLPFLKIYTIMVNCALVIMKIINWSI